VSTPDVDVVAAHPTAVNELASGTISAPLQLLFVGAFAGATPLSISVFVCLCYSENKMMGITGKKRTNDKHGKHSSFLRQSKTVRV
jgi:hypothetical protein